MEGAVQSWPAVLLQVEGAALFGASIWAFRKLGAPWKLFWYGLFVPDISMIGYLLDPATGAATYNTIHTETLPVLLACAGWARNNRRWMYFALIWFAHINSR